MVWISFVRVPHSRDERFVAKLLCPGNSLFLRLELDRGENTSMVSFKGEVRDGCTFWTPCRLGLNVDIGHGWIFLDC